MRYIDDAFRNGSKMDENDLAALAGATARQWAGRAAPGADDIESLAGAAFGELPEQFRAQCDGLVIRVCEFAGDEVLRELDVDDPYDVLGLFTGTGLAYRGAGPQTGELPNSIELYRQPILAYWTTSGETFGNLVAHVLVHEIGHHFGLSDDDMDAIDNAPE